MYLSYESCKTTARSPCNDLALYWKAAARMLRNVLLLLKMAALQELYDVFLCLAAVLQTGATVLRQLCM